MRKIKHGLTKSKIYSIWSVMKQRCYNKKDRRFKDYGGRGIFVCERWRNSFDNFLKDMGTPPTAKHSIDRIDNNKEYSPENCRWATRMEQMANFRRNRYVSFNGKTLHVAEWTRKLGFGERTIAARLNRGWTTEAALTTPIK